MWSYGETEEERRRKLPSPLQVPWEHLGYGEGGPQPPTAAAGPGRPSSLPDTMDYRPPSSTMAGGAPGPMAGLGSTPPPPIEPPVKPRYNELYDARQDFIEKPQSRLKTGLLGALSGALQGLASGGGLAGALGGALAGGGYGAINQKGFRKAQFDATVRPKILERWAFEDAGRAQAAAQQKARMEGMTNQANINNVQDQIRSRQAGDQLNERKFDYEQKNPKLIPVAPGGRLYNTKTGKEEFASPDRPKDPTAAGAAKWLYDSTGETIESLSRKSLEGRLQSLQGRLTNEEQRLVFGKVDASLDDPATVAAARQKWERVMADEFSSIRRDTAARVMAQYQGGGQQPGQPALPASSSGTQPAPPRTTSGGRKAVVGPAFVQHVAEKLKISPEKARQMVIDDGYEIKDGGQSKNLKDLTRLWDKPGGGGRPRSDFNSAKFPGMNFDAKPAQSTAPPQSSPSTAPNQIPAYSPPVVRSGPDLRPEAERRQETPLYRFLGGLGELYRGGKQTLQERYEEEKRRRENRIEQY